MSKVQTNTPRNPKAKAPTNAGAGDTVENHTAVNEAKAKQDAALADIEAKAKADAEAQAKADEEAKAKAASDDDLQQKKGTHEKLDKQKSTDDGAKSGINAVHILGAFTACAKSDAGFWRSGVQFHRQQETLVLVVKQESDAAQGVSTQGYEPECVVCLTAEKAKRVYHEPNLKVEDVELEDLIEPTKALTTE